MDEIKIKTLIEMPRPDDLRATLQVRVTDSVRMEKIMRIYAHLFIQTENNKKSKIWETSDTKIIFQFSYLGIDWEMPVDRIHVFKTYWQKPEKIEWWISYRA